MSETSNTEYEYLILFNGKRYYVPSENRTDIGVFEEPISLTE